MMRVQETYGKASVQYRDVQTPAARSPGRRIFVLWPRILWILTILTVELAFGHPGASNFEVTLSIF